MDKKLPKLLENHIKTLLEEFSVSNWDLKCGKYSTLTIYWKPDSLPSISSKTDNLTTHSIYKKKSPSQVRRDQRRSKNWRNGTPDSGYVKSPVENKCESTNMDRKECSGDLPIESSNQRHGNINSSDPIVSHVQPTVTSHVDNNIVVCELNFDTASLEQVSTLAPLSETVHTANELVIPSKLETVHEIPPLNKQSAIATIEEPTAICFSNVTVKKDTDRPAPNKYINVNSVPYDRDVDISSLFYCKRCHIDLKQYYSDCPLNFNLCTDCCIISNPNCPSCSYYDDT